MAVTQAGKTFVGASADSTCALLLDAAHCCLVLFVNIGPARTAGERPLGLAWLGSQPKLTYLGANHIRFVNIIPSFRLVYNLFISRRRDWSLPISNALSCSSLHALYPEVDYFLTSVLPFTSCLSLYAL